MACRVVVLRRAVDDFASLPTEMRIRVGEALQQLESFPSDRGIKKMRPPFEGFRKRVGDFRILFDVTRNTILVRRIKNRRDAYRA